MREKGKKTIITMCSVLLMLAIIAGVYSVAAMNNDVYNEAPIKGDVTNLRVLLKPYLTYESVECDDPKDRTLYNPYNQRSYKLPNMVGLNNGCGVVSNAIGRSIIIKKHVSPLNYLSGSRKDSMASNPTSELGPKVTISGKQSELLTIYNYINSGNPVRIYKKDTKGNQHFVVICGYYEGTNPDWLSFADFACMDPYTGTIVKLTDSWSWSDYPATEISYRIFKK